MFPVVTGTNSETDSCWLPATDTYHGLSLDPFPEKTVCCLLLEVSRLSLGVLNGFEVLLAELWPLRQAFVFTCTSDVLELEGGDVGEGEGLHIEPCLLSTEGDRIELSTSSVGGESHTRMPCSYNRQREVLISQVRIPEASVLTTVYLFFFLSEKLPYSISFYDF